MDKILDVVIKHPWIDAIQTATLAGCSRQYADRRLHELVEAGMVSTQRVHGLCTFGNLYALTRQGSRQVPLPAYVTQTFIDKALLQAELLWCTRNLLVKLAQAGQLLWSVSPTVEQFRTVDKKRDVTLELSAQGVVVQYERYFPFVVKRDLGAVDTEAFAPFFANLCQWYRWYIYFRPQGSFPIIIIVTINDHRLWRLRELWSRTTFRQQVSPPQCYMAVWRDVRKSNPAVWYRNNQSTPSQLFVGAAGLDKNVIELTPPEPRVITPRIARRSERRWANLIATHLAIPDRRTREVLHRVSAWPLLTDQEVAALRYEWPNQVQASLKRLRELGLVETYPVESGPGYYVSSLGIQLEAAGLGLPPMRYAQLSQWPMVKRSHPPRLNLQALVNSLEHTREVRVFIVNLARMAARYWNELSLKHTLTIWDELQAKEYYTYAGRRWTLAPDSAGTYQIGNQVYHFFLEIDRGTASYAKLARKFDNYYTYMLSGEYRRHWGRLPPLLIVVPNESRARKVRMVIIERARWNRCEVLPAWIVVKDTLDARGADAPIWRNVTRWRFEHCFEGFKSPPESARMMLDLGALSRKVNKKHKAAQTRAKNKAKRLKEKQEQIDRVPADSSAQ